MVDRVLDVERGHVGFEQWRPRADDAVPGRFAAAGRLQVAQPVQARLLVQERVDRARRRCLCLHLCLRCIGLRRAPLGGRVVAQILQLQARRAGVDALGVADLVGLAFPGRVAVVEVPGLAAVPVDAQQEAAGQRVAVDLARASALQAGHEVLRDLHLAAQFGGRVCGTAHGLPFSGLHWDSTLEQVQRRCCKCELSRKGKGLTDKCRAKS